ncbi:5985_t:CDS:2 [Gigaspora margarita]|uniref:5985_t:CDS:1 n=1 Tax=Gigaspora margarita TaxID=4874 RepID=A0ABN7UMZ6_GIGMA|nr:5985_t:CDS:2 [Gigaspora margarita]
MCQFAAPELLTMTHTSVNFEDNLFKKIFDANELSLDTNTLNAFVAAHKTPCGFIHSRTRIQCDGKPKLEQHYQREDDTSEPNYFIGCEKFKNDERGHRYQSLSGRINIQYLKRFFQEHTYYNDGITEEISSSVQHCYLVHPFTYVHITENNQVAQGLIEKKQGCPVRFWHYVPENLEECPYIIIMSRYTHNYPPPPPSKIPVAIQNDLKKYNR